MRIGCIGLACAAALVAWAPGASARERSQMTVPLEPAGGSGGDVRGTAKFRSANGRARFTVKVEEAEADTPLTLLVGGEPVATQTTNRGGKVKFSLGSRRSRSLNGHTWVVPRACEEDDGAGTGDRNLRRSPTQGDELLDFDPRGETVEVSGPNGTLLSASFAPGESDQIRIREETTFRATPDGRMQGTLVFTQQRGVREVELEAEELDPGEHTVSFGGAERGSFFATGEDDGFEFSGGGDPGAEPLDFAVFGESFEVRRDTEVVFSGPALSDAELEPSEAACPGIGGDDDGTAGDDGTDPGDVGGDDGVDPGDIGGGDGIDPGGSGTIGTGGVGAGGGGAGTGGV